MSQKTAAITTTRAVMNKNSGMAQDARLSLVGARIFYRFG
jgi:hypothetical protein